MALEQSGDMAGAAEAYIRALNRDSSLPNVRGRLKVVGREAVARDLAAAARVGPAQAAEHYLSADDLIRKAAGVGVDLDRPASFNADLAAALDRAVEGALVASRRSLDSGDYEQSIQFADTGRRYRPSAQQAIELDNILHIGGLVGTGIRDRRGFATDQVPQERNDLAGLNQEGIGYFRWHALFRYHRIAINQ